MHFSLGMARIISPPCLYIVTTLKFTLETSKLNFCSVTPPPPNYQTKPSKQNLPLNQTYLIKPIKPNLQNQTYQIKPTKPKLPNEALRTKLTKPNLTNPYLIFVTGATGGGRVNFFWPV